MPGTDFFTQRNQWYWLAFFLLLVVLGGLWIDVMDVDASQYASISMEMLQNGSWLEVQHRGADYLDKPPLLFWCSAAMFGLFGLQNWAYKLPSLLFALAGIYAVYRFARLFYQASTARNAAFILAAGLGLVIVCNDVRTDTMLLGASACSVWLLAEHMKQPNWRWLIGAFACIGLAMLAKGPIGLVLPVFAVGTHIALKREWQWIFRWQWLVGLAVTALVLAPMSWGLYQQFDLHPEKLVNHRTGVSGLYFFFWEQSFGRITGGNVWKNDAGYFYFLHVYLWAFLPWAMAFYVFFAQDLVQLVKNRFRLPTSAEAYSLGAFTLTFIALSLSRYKLPHYIFVTLPWAAVLTAKGLERWQTHARAHRWPWILLYIPLFAALVVAWLIPLAVFPTHQILIVLPLGLLTALLLYRIYKNPFPASAAQFVQRGATGLLAAAFVLNFHFYPQLLPYQSSSALMHWAKTQNIPADDIAFFKRHGHALDFYAGKILPEMKDVEDIRAFTAQHPNAWIYTNEEGREALDAQAVPYVVAKTMGHFQVALLNFPFLNPAVREKTLQPVYLLKMGPISSQ
ncbi:MAG: glycosyltransferase family 39 protein [Lewinellaceae bacterium]|nr:glycosyltransferase family 39 protein [Lewinellaceae bacterium]